MPANRKRMGGDQAASLGWVGAGRMGRALVTRLLDAGHEVGVYNRTLGFEAAREMDVAMPVAAATEQIVQGLAAAPAQG